jgi:hypothetical protein
MITKDKVRGGRGGFSFRASGLSVPGRNVLDEALEAHPRFRITANTPAITLSPTQIPAGTGTQPACPRQILRAIAPAYPSANGAIPTTSAFHRTASAKCPWSSAASARVPPHPGHSNPVAWKMGQRG